VNAVTNQTEQETDSERVQHRTHHGHAKTGALLGNIALKANQKSGRGAMKAIKYAIFLLVGAVIDR